MCIDVIELSIKPRYHVGGQYQQRVDENAAINPFNVAAATIADRTTSLSPHIYRVAQKRKPLSLIIIISY